MDIDEVAPEVIAAAAEVLTKTLIPRGQQPTTGDKLAHYAVAKLMLKAAFTVLDERPCGHHR